MTQPHPVYNDEMGLSGFLAQPHDAIANALLLRFQPTFLDILPLYIVLLFLFPIADIALAVSPWLVLIPSAALYVATQIFHITMPAFPPGHSWYFNPFAWQFLFLLGAACGFQRVVGTRIVPRGDWLFVGACVVAGIAAILKISWAANALDPVVPALLGDLLKPIAGNKSNLSPLRLINFVAIASVVTRLIPRDAGLFTTGWARPFILCGQHSLPVFCLSILLSALGQFLLAEWQGGVWLQVAVNVVGCAAMVGTARLIAWYGAMTKSSEPSPPPRGAWRGSGMPPLPLSGIVPGAEPQQPERIRQGVDPPEQR